MTVLSDRTIKEELAAGRLVIQPLDVRDIQPASVDLHLDRQFRIFRVTSRPYVDVREPMEDLTELVDIADGEPFIVQPGSFVLGCTLESVTLPDDIVARVDGRSSLGPVCPWYFEASPGEPYGRSTGVDIRRNDICETFIP